MPEVKITAAIITLNEERNIGRCLEGLQGLADEVVVVDSGSTDATRAICEKYGVQWHVSAFQDYADQKNLAASLGTHDVVLSLDADEVPSPTLRASILAAKKQWIADAYSMHRLTQYCGTWIRHGGWYPDTKIRLYDRRKAEWTGQKIHEKIQVTPGASVAMLNGDLLHYSFYSIEQHMATVNRFSTLKAEKMFASERKSPLWRQVLGPVIKFTELYLFKQGFRDGHAGFNIAINSAHGEFLKYAKLKQLYRNTKSKPQ